jgi:hypothetical protein
MDLAIKISDWIFFLSIIMAFVVSLIHRENKDLRPIQLYIIVSLIVDICTEGIELLSKNNSAFQTVSIITNLYSLIEISIIFYFFFKITKVKLFRICILIFLMSYFSVCILIWTGKYKALLFIVPQLFGLENFFISIACLFYAFETLNSNLLTNLNSNPFFTVTCGILFYSSIMTPLSFSYFIWANTAPELNKVVQIVNTTFYSILSISLIKAFLCPFPEQKQSQFFVL